MDFEVRARSLDRESCVVQFVGELDVYTCRIASKEFLRLLEGHHRLFLTDLSRLTFIDSAGLGMLVRFQRRLRDMEGDLVVTGASPPVRRLFRVTGLDSLFLLAANVEEALCSWRTRTQEQPVSNQALLGGPQRL